jgi:tight adherence protein B
MSYLVIIIGCSLLVLGISDYIRTRRARHWLYQNNRGESNNKAFVVSVFSEQKMRQKIASWITRTYSQIGSYAHLKIIAYVALLFLLANVVNNVFLSVNIILIVVAFEMLGLFLAANWLKKREEDQFKENFPTALNMLTSAVSSGEGLLSAISFVGDNLSGNIGDEFKKMGDELRLGDSPTSVFDKSCRRLPYAPYLFFIITLKTSMQRGGQLKEVLGRLNRLMFGARAIEKKKLALTSEARASAKIVCAIPFIFLFLMRFISPADYDYVMFNEDGRIILYYLLISESLGMWIIYMIMKGVKI